MTTVIEQSALEKIEAELKERWLQSGGASIIAARHTEFVVEPRILIGNKLNPEILRLLVLNYLQHSLKTGGGNIEVGPDKMVIKSPRGKPLVTVRDQKLIQQFRALRG